MKKFVFPSLALIGTTWSLTVACELNDPCDPGQTFEYGVCLPADPENEGAGGEGGCDEMAGGAGGVVECIEPPNFGTRCTEGGDECVGGTVCGAPQLPKCIGLCGPGDPFEGSCPDGLSCTDFPEASVCF